jgi:hypothetical protein
MVRKILTLDDVSAFPLVDVSERLGFILISLFDVSIIFSFCVLFILVDVCDSIRSLEKQKNYQTFDFLIKILPCFLFILYS